jgi:hypothetical protein
LRTILRDTRNSRQIVYGLFWAKYARRIFAIVSTTSIPDLAPVSPTEATVDPPSRGSRLDADHPENGVLIPCRFTAGSVGWGNFQFLVSMVDIGSFNTALDIHFAPILTKGEWTSELSLFSSFRSYLRVREGSSQMSELTQDPNLSLTAASS